MKNAHSGFTLIELSIVLVVLGLVVGGVLVGRELIGTSQANALINQIAKYRQAVSTFEEKYEYLPGDIPTDVAARFGFTEVCCIILHGNGNGVIEQKPQFTNGREAGIFWWDLARSGLIEDRITTGGDGDADYYLYNPKSKVTESFISVLSGGVADVSSDLTTGRGSNGINYYTFVDYKFQAWSGTIGPSVPVKLAAAIDKKSDDGLPQTGNILAAMWSKSTAPGCCTVFSWAGYNIPNLASGNNATPSTAATAGSSTTCYDNNNTANEIQKYSVSQNGGNGVNCGLTFAF